MERLDKRVRSSEGHKMNYNNRWYKLPQDEKDRINRIPYGWIVHNLLLYGNSLIDKKAIRKVGILKLVNALEEELVITGNGDTEIRVKKVKNESDNEIDCIAYLVKREGAEDD